MRPRQTTTRKSVSSFISWSSHGAQLRSSSGVGLFPGGAQRAIAVIQSPFSFIPSSRETAFGLRCKPRFMQHRIQKVARSIASERPSRAIRSMRSRRQSQRHHARLRIAERRHRPSPILPVQDRPAAASAPLQCNARATAGKARTTRSAHSALARVAASAMKRFYGAERELMANLVRRNLRHEIRKALAARRRFC